MSFTKIPFRTRSHKYETLQACIERVSRETRFNQFQVAVLISYFLEELCEQVARNRAVNIPGFGMFAPVTWKPRTRGGGKPYCVPKFAASRGFRNAVRTQCSTTGAWDKAMRRHAQRHHYSNRHFRSAARPFTTFAAWRAQFLAQARRVGMPTDNGPSFVPRAKKRRPPEIDFSKL